MKNTNTIIKTLIIADDDEDDRLFFSEAVEELDMGLTLHTVSDGEQLLALLSKVYTTGDILVFLDVNMPKKNGIRILQEMRADEKFEKVCVLMYTTSSSPHDIKSAREGKANAFVKKPSDFNDLKKIIKKAVMHDWHCNTWLSHDNFVFAV